MKSSADQDVYDLVQELQQAKSLIPVFAFEEKCSAPARVSIPEKPTPTNAMRFFSGDIQQGEHVKDENLLSINGWLTPQGELFGCAWQNHYATLSMTGYKTEKDAELAGYIKLSEMHWHIEPRWQQITLNAAQMATIIAWHEKNNLRKDYFLFYKTQLGL